MSSNVGGNTVGRRGKEDGTRDTGDITFQNGFIWRPFVIDPFGGSTNSPWHATTIEVPGRYTFSITKSGVYDFTASEAFYDFLAGSPGDAPIGTNGIPGGPTYSITETFTVSYNARDAGGGTTIPGGTHTLRFDIQGQKDAGQPCFTRGALIMTPTGPQPIETLEAGDLVITRDHGLQPIRWIGSAKLKARGPRGLRRRAPIRIKAGALGHNMPERDTLVSPQHRMLVSTPDTRLMFEQDEVLVAAKYLVNGDTITVANDVMEVEYFHMLFDTHQVVYADGAPSESYHPVHQSMEAFSDEVRAEIIELFPELNHSQHAYGQAARYSLYRYEGEALARQMFGAMPPPNVTPVQANAAHARRAASA